MSTLSSVIFPSKSVLQTTLQPLNFDEATARMSGAKSRAICFSYDESMGSNKIVPLRNSGIGNLLKTEVFKTAHLTVYYPEVPRVPHHLSIALNRSVKSLPEVTIEENREIFATIRKIAEIFKTVGLGGFVVAQFEKPQLGHSGRCAIEVIPHLPGFKDAINVFDKVDCNRHVLFRGANITPAIYKMVREEIGKQAAFWQSAFQNNHPSLTDADTRITFPYTKRAAHEEKAIEFAYQHLLEIFENQGAKTGRNPSYVPVIPTEAEIKETGKVEKCFFCDPAVIKRQLIYEFQDILVFLNMRKGPKPGSYFLVLPKRHAEKVYGLNEKEIDSIFMVRKALTEVLREVHPNHEMIDYIQDAPSTGQTVFHHHENVVSVDPKTIATSWTIQSVYSPENISDEEMLTVRTEMAQKLEQKMKESTKFEQTA